MRSFVVWAVVVMTTTAALAVGYDTVPAYPNPLDFGNVRFDQTKTLALSVVDTDGTSLQITGAAITPGTAMANEFAVASCTHNGTGVPCPTTNTPFALTGVNDTLVVNVICDPANRVSAFDATITITSNLSVNPSRVVPLKCNATTATAVFDPSNQLLDFGAVDLDASPVSVMRTIHVMNTGIADLNIGAATMGGAGLARFTFSATPATVVTHGNSFDVDVVYTPATEKPPTAPDVASITFPLTGNFGGPSSVMVQIQGYGADRHIAVSATPAFPDTFRNPGDLAPVLPLTLTNNGYAPLSLTAVMVTNDPVWTIVNPDPVTVPAVGTHDVEIRFAPIAAGPAPIGHLVIMNNDNLLPMAAVDLAGTGIDRQVAMGPAAVDIGDTAVGVPLALSDLGQDALLTVTNQDAARTFSIREIAVDADAGFAVVTPDGAAPADVALAPLSTQRFDIVLTPTHDGMLETSAALYLDMDPVPQTTVTVRARAAEVDAHGAGGCSTGRGNGSLGFVLVALAALLRRRRIAAVLAITASGIAHADDINTELFRPTPSTHADTFQLQSADVGANGDWAASAHVSVETNPVEVDARIDGQPISSDRPVTRRAGIEVGGAYAFLDRFEAGVRIPMYQQTGNAGGTSGYDVPDASGTALGDIGVHVSARLWRADAVATAATLHVTLPTSSDGRFVGTATLSARALALASYRVMPALVLSANGGVIARGTSTYSNGAAVRITQGSGVAWGIGVTVHATGALRLSAEAFGDVGRASDSMAGSRSAVEVLAGAHYHLASGVVIGVAGGRGMTAALGTPDARAVLSIAYSSSRTQTHDVASIIEPRVVTPAPSSDRDHDGITDANDTCADQPEDKDGFQDQDGCPDDDNDGDLIVDSKDACPTKPEVINGVDDNDGCPDVTDSAGIAVSGNKSPTQAAEETFKQGRELMRQQKFASACAAFEQSQRLDPQQGTQFNLAGCYVEIGKLATALTMFRELGRSDKNLERRTQENDTAAKLAARVPKLRVTMSVSPMGAQVFVNNVNSNALIGIDTPVDFGSYEIVAGAPGFKPWRKTVEIKEAAKVTVVNVQLEEVPSAP